MTVCRVVISRLCAKINHGDLMDLTMFFFRLAENFARVVQYNKLDLEMLVPYIL